MSDEVSLTEADALLQDPQLQEAAEIGEEFKSSIERCLTVRETTLKSLRKLKHETEESYDKSRKARIGGTVATITGATIGIIGFGLGFVTAGIGLVVLGVTGAVIAGAGSVTVGGAEIGYLAVSQLNIKHAQAACDTDREAMQEAKNLHEKLTSCIESLQKKHPRFSEEDILAMVIKTVKYGVPAAKGMFSSYKLVDAVWEVGRSIFTAVEIATSTTKVGARTAWAGLNTGTRIASSVSVVFDIAVLPIDLIILIKSAYDVHKYKGGKGTSNSAAAEKIGELIKNLEQNKAEMKKIEEEFAAAKPDFNLETFQE